MKAPITIIAFCILSFNLTADYWTQKANFPGAPRWIATGFAIGDKGYIGTGSDGTSGAHLTNDFWEYDVNTNTWIQIADFGGTARWGSVGFSIGSKGYVSGGMDASNFQQDLWEYDPLTNSWTQMANLPAPGREFFAGFSIGRKGYVGTGYSPTHLQDFWEWDQLTNTWTQKANFTGAARRDVIGMSVGNKGYIGTGYSTSLHDDFWEWDPLTNVWTQRANVGGGPRNVATAFSFCRWGFIGTGAVNGISSNDFWQWDQYANQWTQKAGFPGPVREHAVGFTINNKGYIGTGGNYPNNILILLDDFWEYTSDNSCEVGVENIIPESEVKMYVYADNVHIETNLKNIESISIKIMDINGKIYNSVKPDKGHTSAPLSTSTLISISELPRGVFFAVADDGKARSIKKFVR